MSERLKAAIPAALALLLGSCAARPQFLFFLDTYTAQLEPGLAGGRSPLAQELAPEFRTAAAVRPLTADAEKQLRALLARRRPSAVYLSPLFDLEPEALLAEFPDITFVRPGQPAAGPGWVSIRFDYESAMRAAGRLAARLAGQVGGGSGRVGILAAGSASWLQDRVAAFREGVRAEDAEGSPIYRQVESANDRVRARQLLEEMRQEGAGLFLLLSYSLTGFCLEYLQKQGAVAIAQDAAAAAAYPDAVLLYLEEDMPAALRQLRGLARSGDLSRRGGAPEVLSAPVRLRPGPAFRALPAGAVGGLQELEGVSPQ